MELDLDLVEVAQRILRINVSLRAAESSTAFAAGRLRSISVAGLEAFRRAQEAWDVQWPYRSQRVAVASP
jgi:hypothetical protein